MNDGTKNFVGGLLIGFLTGLGVAGLVLLRPWESPRTVEAKAEEPKPVAAQAEKKPEVEIHNLPYGDHGEHAYRFPYSDMNDLLRALTRFRREHKEYADQVPAVFMPGPPGSYGSYGYVVMFREPTPKPKEKP